MRLLPALLSVLLLAGCQRADDGALVVYSERREPLIEPIFARYRAETGVEVRFITDQAPVLIERLAAEGERTRADLFLAVDAGNLWLAAERGLLASIESAPLQAAIPAHLRDPDGRWFALSLRARTIIYARDRIEATELVGYEDLADARWKGRLCLRSSKKVYNQSLTAMLLARLGETETERILRGWVANLAAPPFADDTLLVQAVAAGQCDVGIVNTYYLGRLQARGEALQVWPYWPDETGVHVNISGAGVTAHAPHREAAVRFLEWLATPAVQADFASINQEYPATPGIALHPVVAAWGPFRHDPINVVEAGRRQVEAVMLMDRVGWN
ncbi:MAG TPA: extracellular solute-binding protein [Xanthomonadaceae bacterium]|nr:extracellular solute-binding protein [Xanthomonadaceae bacterium]